MDERTLTALKASIEHWEANVAAETVDDASTRASDCALCTLFARDDDEEDACIGCPVMDRTGRNGCGSTPYHAAYVALYTWRKHKALVDAHDNFRIAAKAELDFLRSLLPADEAST